SDNPYAKSYPEFRSAASLYSQQTAQDGSFRIVTVPGPVILMGHANDSLKYKMPAPDPRYPRYFADMQGYPSYFTFGGGRGLLQGNCKVLEIPPDATIVKQDLVLERANLLTVKVQDTAGRPLGGVWATGVSPVNFSGATRAEGNSCTAYDVEKPRLMVFYE